MIGGCGMHSQRSACRLLLNLKNCRGGRAARTCSCPAPCLLPWPYVAPQGMQVLIINSICNSSHLRHRLAKSGN